jgi:hypothetical protein
MNEVHSITMIKNKITEMETRSRTIEYPRNQDLIIAIEPNGMR